MKKIHKIIKNHWQRQGVKFKVSKEKLVWIKTLRSVDCAICKKHLVEKREDEGFDNWRIMPEIINPQGKAPEICPDCAKKFNLPFRPARRAQCKKCGITQKEKIFGIGFPGWLIAPREQNKGLLKGFCPNCYANFIAPSMPQFIHSTWYDLTFASGSLLTSTKMTQLDGNLDALAAQESGAPTIDHGSLSGLADDDHTQYLNTTRHDTTARHGSSVVDHGSIGGLADDDHTQYLNTTRHDTTDRHPNTVIKTATGSATGTIGTQSSVNVAMNAYCFFPNIYSEGTSTVRILGFSTDNADQVGRFRFYNESSSNTYSYTVRWRYITASGNPQIWIITDSVTGEILCVWQSDDPPAIKRDPFKEIPIQYHKNGEPYGITGYTEIPNFLDEFKETLKVGVEEVRKRYRLREKSVRPKSLPTNIKFLSLEKV